MRVITKKSEYIKPQIKDLLDQPIVIRVNKFTEEAVKDFCQNFNLAHQTGQSIIPIVIDSYGGQVHSLLAMIAEIENTPLKVATVCVGKAMSCGAILLACGTVGLRFAGEHSTIMVHQVSAGSIGKVEDMKVSVKEADRLNKLIFEKMSKACGQKSNYFLNLLDTHKNTDWYLTSKNAKAYKIIDHIGVPTLKVNVSISEELVLANGKKLEY